MPQNMIPTAPQGVAPAGPETMPPAPPDHMQGLQNLTPPELQELDQLLTATPRIAQLLAKAFPWAAQALAPLLQDNNAPGEQPATPGGPIPRPSTPLGRVGA